MKRILFIAPRFHTNQFYPVKILRNNNFEVKFISYVSSHKMENKEDITPIMMGYSPLFNLFFKNFRSGKTRSSFFRKYGIPPFFKMLKTFNDFKPDLIIIREYYFYSICSVLIAKLLRIRFIIYTQKPKFDMSRISNARSDKITKKIFVIIKDLFFSKFEMTPLMGERQENSIYYNENTIIYVPLVIEKNSFLNQKKRTESDIVKIITVAEFQEGKKILELLHEFKKLADTYRVSLTIIGNTGEESTKKYLQEVIHFIDSNRLSDRVVIMTDILHHQVMKEYLKHDIFVLPSMHETAGYAVLEAMSSEMPVICSTGCGLKEYIIHGESGFIFEKNNFDELSQYLERLIKNPQMIDEFGKKNIELVEKNYLPSKYFEGIQRIWERIQ